MQTPEIEKSKIYNLIELIEYEPNSVVSKTIIRKATGNICIMAIEAGEILTEKTFPFDKFIQIIEGLAELIIDNKPNMLQTGQAIIIPAYTANIIKAIDRFKMISILIKSGYEENSI